MFNDIIVLELLYNEVVSVKRYYSKSYAVQHAYDMNKAKVLPDNYHYFKVIDIEHISYA